MKFLLFLFPIFCMGQTFVIDYSFEDVWDQARIDIQIDGVPVLSVISFGADPAVHTNYFTLEPGQCINIDIYNTDSLTFGIRVDERRYVRYREHELPYEEKICHLPIVYLNTNFEPTTFEQAAYVRRGKKLMQIKIQR